MDFCCFYFPLFCIHWLMGKDMPANAIVGGVPAKIIKMIELK